MLAISHILYPKDQKTSFQKNYISKYSAAIALKYLIKWTIRNFKMHYTANIYYFGIRIVLNFNYNSILDSKQSDWRATDILCVDIPKVIANRIQDMSRDDTRSSKVNKVYSQS